jgi:hypothetical protein
MAQPMTDWDDITEPMMALTLAPSDAPPTENNLEAPTEVPACPVTLPAPPDIPKDITRGRCLPLDFVLHPRLNPNEST